jgi:hypothetical protein
MLPNSFNKVNITLIPKLDEDTAKKENYRTISLMNIDTEVFNKILVTKAIKEMQIKTTLRSTSPLLE